MPRVIIADPDAASRKALFLWLVYKVGVDEIIQVADGGELIDKIEASMPDIILMDWGLTNRPSLEYCQEVQRKSPTLQWVILSVDGTVAQDAIHWSPWFIQKGLSPEAIFTLLNQVLNE